MPSMGGEMFFCSQNGHLQAACPLVLVSQLNSTDSLPRTLTCVQLEVGGRMITQGALVQGQMRVSWTGDDGNRN